jgi:hypothetical protein
MTDPKVDEYITALEPVEQAFVTYVRTFVQQIDPEIREHIKWNSLAFFYSGEMEEFDAKEYKRDILVVNLHRGKFLLVFPTGSKIENSILKGKNYPDGRKILTIDSLSDLKKIESDLKAGIINWLAQIEK